MNLLTSDSGSRLDGNNILYIAKRTGLIRGYKRNSNFCLIKKIGRVPNRIFGEFKEIRLELQALGLSPGVSLFLQGVKVTKQKGFFTFNIACKWKRKIKGVVPNEGWFILTNLETLESAFPEGVAAGIAAYKKRFNIEEMFRYFKKGGYNLEDTNVSDQRLINLILLIAIAYTGATITGQNIKRKGVQKYVGCVKESGRILRRHSSFYIGLYGQSWVNFLEQCHDLVIALIKLSRNKQKYYQRGQRAMELILSAS